MGFPRWLRGKEFTCDGGDMGSIPGLERFPGKGNGKPFQFSCLENPMDREEPGRLWSTGSHRVGHDLVIEHTYYY